MTKALVGLFGTDRFRLAVSADGSTFFDGLSVDNATGIVDQPRLPRFKAWTNYDNYVGVGTWTKIGLNNTDYNDQGAFDAMRTKPSDRGGFIGSSFRRSADLAAPEGRVIGGEVAVRDPEIPLQLDGIAGSQRDHRLQPDGGGE